MKQNPKFEGSNVIDCIPQVGPCPNNCNQCFYNRPGAFYSGFEPNIPTVKEVGDKIVRMNCGHDSNFQRDLVIETAKQYKHFFFNTSIPNFDFPGPIVFTANPKEEEYLYFQMRETHKEYGESPLRYFPFPFTPDMHLDNLMFIRLRVSPTNLGLIEKAVRSWIDYQIPVVLTFMAYYDQAPPGCELRNFPDDPLVYTWRDPRDNRSIQEQDKRIVAYTWKKRHINSYYCPTKAFMSYVLKRMKKIGGRLVTMCGTLDSSYCRDCGNCEHFYFLTLKHLQEVG